MSANERKTTKGVGLDESSSIIEAVIPQRFPEIDPHLWIGEIELDPGAIEGLLGVQVAGHKEREFLMPLAGPGDFLLAQIFDFGCDAFHTNSFLAGLPEVRKTRCGIHRSAISVQALSADMEVTRGESTEGGDRSPQNQTVKIPRPHPRVGRVRPFDTVSSEL
jgi:hypothetical protein